MSRDDKPEFTLVLGTFEPEPRHGEGIVYSIKFYLLTPLPVAIPLVERLTRWQFAHAAHPPSSPPALTHCIEKWTVPNSVSASTITGTPWLNALGTIASNLHAKAEGLG